MSFERDLSKIPTTPNSSVSSSQSPSPQSSSGDASRAPSTAAPILPGTLFATPTAAIISPDSTLATPPPVRSAQDSTLATAPPVRSAQDSTLATPPPVKRSGFALAIPQELLTPSVLASEKAVEAHREAKVRASRLEVTRQNSFRAPAVYVAPSENRFRRWLDDLMSRLSGTRRANDLAVSFRELGVMLDSGIVITHALELLSTTLNDAGLRQAFRTALDTVNAGSTLSKGLERSVDVFPRTAIELCRIAERTGRLPDVLNRIADMLEGQNRTIKSLQSKMTYPAFTLVLCLALVVFVPSLLFNGIFDLLRSLRVEVPLATKILMALSQLVRSPWAYLMAGVVLVCLARAYRDLMQYDAHRRRRDALLLRLPTLGEAVHQALLVQFTGTLECLYQSGAPIIPALTMAAQTTGNIVFEERVAKVADSVKHGTTLHDAMRLSGEFPSSLVHLVTAGDESGHLPEMLGFAAKLGQQEIDMRLERLMAALEPMLILGLGTVVGVVVLSTLYPLIKVLEAMSF